MIVKGKMLGLMLAATMVVSLPMVVYADNVEQKPSPSAEASHQDGDWHHAKEAKMTADILNLSEDQQKQLQDIHQKQKDAMKNVFEQMKANKEALDSEIIKTAPDMSKINELQAQFKTIQAQMADNRLNSILAIKKFMTPEQFAGWMALEKEEMLMKHHGRHGFGPKDRDEKMGEGDAYAEK